MYFLHTIFSIYNGFIRCNLILSQGRSVFSFCFVVSLNITVFVYFCIHFFFPLRVMPGPFNIYFARLNSKTVTWFQVIWSTEKYECSIQRPFTNTICILICFNLVIHGNLAYHFNSESYLWIIAFQATASPSYFPPNNWLLYYWNYFYYYLVSFSLFFNWCCYSMIYFYSDSKEENQTTLRKHSHNLQSKTLRLGFIM